MIKILHTADLHIGTTFSSFGEELSKKMAELQIRALIDMVKYANNNFVDVIIIAGDLFHNHTVSMSLKSKTLDLLSNFNGKIFITCGNHDFYFKDSFWDKIAIPENIYVFKNNHFEIFESSELCIHGASFTDTYDTLDLNTLHINSNKINIAIAHSDLLTKSKYNSYTKEQIANTKLDYFALGHNHSFSGILNEDNVSYSCSGGISCCGKDETGDFGFVILEISKSKKNFSFVKSTGAKILQKSIDISKVQTEEDFQNAILEFASLETYLDLKLEGIKDGVIDTNVLKERYKKHFLHLEVSDNSSSTENLWQYYYDESLVGEFTRLMHKKYNENPSTKILQALKIGLDSLMD